MALHGTSNVRRSDCLMVTGGVSSEWGQLGSVGGQSGVSCIGQHFMCCQMLIHALPRARGCSYRSCGFTSCDRGSAGSAGSVHFSTCFFFETVGDIIYISDLVRQWTLFFILYFSLYPVEKQRDMDNGVF